MKSHFSPADYSADTDARKNVSFAVRGTGRAVRFSSSLPWLLAIMLSVGLWAGLGLSLWWFLHQT
jgi:hypothetical protein